MRKLGGVSLIVIATFALQFFESRAVAFDRMDDWVGQNNHPDNLSGVTNYAPDNAYKIISTTRVGGQMQSKINFGGAIPGEIANANIPFIYLADQALEGPALDFTSELHMTGTITFNSPMNTEPNICFCWYSSENTAARVGLGISNRTVAQGGAIANHLRMDFGYAAAGGNRFYYASEGGDEANTSPLSVMPNGEYTFDFDYVPQAIGVPGLGGTMSLTVGNPTFGTYFRTVAPMETEPWELDLNTLDRFGIVQRSTGNTTQLGKYWVTFSNVEYTGGTDAPATPGANDLSEDDEINAADYVAYRKFAGTNLDNPPTSDDLPGYDAFFAHYGEAIPGGGSVGVPEPSSLILCLVASVAWIFSGRNSRRR
jgi:hypothetical protein